MAFSEQTDTWEIERKFLLRELPADLASYPCEAIRQGYLAMLVDGSSVRLRQKGEHYVQTIKQGTGVQRAELEIALTKEQFDTLWPLTEGRRVQKTRYEVPYGEHAIEVDVYHGMLAPLVTAEVEFDSTEASEAFTPPSWFGQEVTDDIRYTNPSLAQHGIPPGVYESRSVRG